MEKKNAIAKMKQDQDETTNLVLTRVNEFQNAGQLTLPSDFSPENALKAAWFNLLETKDKGGKSVLDTCTKGSITNALFEMILQGLNPMKKQCAFIAYGDKLSMIREYHGTIALAKRFGGVKSANAHVIYDGDVFQYSYNNENGSVKVVKYEPKLENINHEKIKGAFAILILADGSEYIEVMNMAQIKNAWNQGAMKGQSPAHKNFPDQMAKKTVINRACKLFISSSDDGSIIDLNKEDNKDAEFEVDDANEETLDVEAMDVTPKKEVKKETPKAETKAPKKEEKKEAEKPKKEVEPIVKKDGQVEVGF